MDPDELQLDSAPDTRPLDPSLRLEAVPYQPDGGWSPLGLLIVLGLTALGAVGLGYLSSWISQWFSIIILFPFLIGLGVGCFGVMGIVVGKVRNPFLAVLAGLFGGCLAMATQHYADYQRELARAPAWAANPPETFREFLDAEARKGLDVRLRRLHFNLGYTLTYIYWIAEILIASGTAIVLMWSASADPFCTLCRSWKAKRVLGTLDLSADSAMAIFTSGEIVRLADHDFRPGVGQIRLTVTPCGHCGTEAPVDVKVDQVTKNAKDEEVTTELAYVTYPGQALPILESLFHPAEGPADVVTADVDDNPDER